MTTAQLATVVLGTSGAAADDVIAVARHGAHVELSPEAREEVARVRAHVDALAKSDTPVYGISTGFGALATKHVPADYRTQLQKSLIRSHAAGMGPVVEREVVRALMFLRAKTLASGRTGIRPEVLETMIALLNAGSNIPARMAMMAITTSSSMRVKPRFAITQWYHHEPQGLL